MDGKKTWSVTIYLNSRSPVGSDVVAFNNIIRACQNLNSRSPVGSDKEIIQSVLLNMDLNSRSPVGSDRCGEAHRSA